MAAGYNQQVEELLIRTEGVSELRAARGRPLGTGSGCKTL